MRRRFIGGLGLAIVAAVGFIFYLSTFIVGQTEQALVLRFGQNVNPLNFGGGDVIPVTSPGLYFKLPLIDNVAHFEKRILDLDLRPLEITASDRKRLVVDAFGRYRIIDALKFYQSVGTVAVANTRLSQFLESAVRRVTGDASFIDLVRDKRAELMTRITQQVDVEARGLGIEMIDVKIRGADLPQANSQAIYQRMQTDFQRQATEFRAEGEQAARTIRAEADRQATVTVAEANGAASRLQGDGEAERNRIFAAAFGKDPDFFAFYRSMEAYQKGLKAGDTRLVITPNSDFFRFFNNPAGTSGDSGAPAPAQ